MDTANIIINLYKNQCDPICSAKIVFVNKDNYFCGYTDACGLFNIRVPRGQYDLIINADKCIEVNYSVTVKYNNSFHRIKLYEDYRGTICGKVVDICKKPIIDANVILFNEKDIPVGNTSTDFEGMYYFYDMPPGVYYTMASKN